VTGRRLTLGLAGGTPDRMTESPPSADDCELVGVSAEIAIPALLERHGGKLYALGCKLCHSADDAEDLVQEVFLNAYRSWPQFEGRSRVTTWLYTIAARVCQRLHRKRAGEPEHLASLEELLPFGEAGVPSTDALTDSPEGEQLRREGLERLEAAIATLPLDFRIPLVLKEIVGLPLADIAGILGVQVGTVKSRLHRGRLRLRKAVLEGVPLEDAPDPAYSRQVCLDLLEAKQDALDNGVEFDSDRVVCERCIAVFESLDLTDDLCRLIGAGEVLPGQLREAILATVADGDPGSES
jgi:RNA polymerase sigma-70 factor (ECF subfamily)